MASLRNQMSQSLKAARTRSTEVAQKMQSTLQANLTGQRSQQANMNAIKVMQQQSQQQVQQTQQQAQQTQQQTQQQAQQTQNAKTTAAQQQTQNNLNNIKTEVNKADPKPLDKQMQSQQQQNNQAKMAVISNKLHTLALKSVKKYFDSYITEVIGAEGGFPRKPSPDSTLFMLKKFGCHPSNAFFVGDSTVDIKTAKNANISSVAVSWGNGEIEDFRKQKSDYIIHHPQEILDVFYY